MSFNPSAATLKGHCEILYIQTSLHRSMANVWWPKKLIYHSVKKIVHSYVLGRGEGRHFMSPPTPRVKTKVVGNLAELDRE